MLNFIMFFVYISLFLCFSVNSASIQLKAFLEVGSNKMTQKVLKLSSYLLFLKG